MNQNPQRIDPAFCLGSTARIEGFKSALDTEPDLESTPERYRDLARRDNQRLRDNVRLDKHREHRLRSCKCLRCQYRTTIAGAAITTRPCGLCLEPQSYGSTNTGVMCVSCAHSHGLCAHCGGDVNGDMQRTEYPTSPDAVSRA